MHSGQTTGAAATLIGQRSKRGPLVRLDLERVEGESAVESMAGLANTLLDHSLNNSSLLVAGIQ